VHDPRPASVGSGPQTAAQVIDALAHADQAVPVRSWDRIADRTADAELEHPLVVNDPYLGSRKGRVLANVGQGFLEDSIGGQIDCIRQRARPTLLGHGDLGP